MTDQIIKEKVFNHPIERVWKAITKAEEISQWFIHADFKAEKGYAYTFTATEEHGSTQIKGKVLEADPYTLKYTWNVGEAPVETTVTWTLESQGNNQTRLTLVHDGIDKFEGESAVEMFGHFEKGWEACLSVLPEYLNNENTKPAH
jgi:uncharacterized protein YndB with AHSA1/START domain